MQGKMEHLYFPLVKGSGLMVIGNCVWCPYAVTTVYLTQNSYLLRSCLFQGALKRLTCCKPRAFYRGDLDRFAGLGIPSGQRLSLLNSEGPKSDQSYLLTFL